MGLFASRPEEPSEWAGIPSEPLQADPSADLSTGGRVLDALELVEGESLTSVTIALEIPASREIPVPQDQDSDERTG